MTIDLESYFQRIGYRGPREPTLELLQAITWHHATSIPFENLDVLMGKPIDLAPEAIFQKLVIDQRGGYCFEQNGLLLMVLRQLGYTVTPLSARVRWQMPREITPPRTHLFLRVHFPEGDWLTDCGVGVATLTGPIPLQWGRELPTPHEPRRLVREEDGRFFHQLWTGRDWADVCEFTLEEMPPIDCELANWWTSGHPASRFKSTLMVARAGQDGTRKAIRDTEFIHRHGPEILERMELTAATLPAILEKHFGLLLPAGARLGPPGAPWA